MAKLIVSLFPLFPLALCTDGSVRLVVGETADFFYLQGTPLADSYYDNDVLRAGRVEVCFRGTYVTVCDTAWDNIGASVVCRQLGFSLYGAVGVRNNFPQSTLMATLQNVNCTGSESNLLQCGYTAGPAGTCGGFQDAGAVCQGLVFSNGLFNPATPCHFARHFPPTHPPPLTFPPSLSHTSPPHYLSPSLHPHRSLSGGRELSDWLPKAWQQYCHCQHQ